MVDHNLMERIQGLRPWECDRLTLAEIDHALTDPKVRSRGPDRSDMEILAYAQWWGSLTPAERLRQGVKDG